MHTHFEEIRPFPDCAARLRAYLRSSAQTALSRNTCADRERRASFDSIVTLTHSLINLIEESSSLMARTRASVNCTPFRRSFAAILAVETCAGK
jgi:hypothetical protein